MRPERGKSERGIVFLKGSFVCDAFTVIFVIQLGKDPATISKWCTNTSQPDLVTLTKVAALLDVDVRQLINKTKGINTDD